MTNLLLARIIVCVLQSNRTIVPPVPSANPIFVQDTLQTTRICETGQKNSQQKFRDKSIRGERLLRNANASRSRQAVRSRRTTQLKQCVNICRIDLYSMATSSFGTDCVNWKRALRLLHHLLDGAFLSFHTLFWREQWMQESDECEKGRKR